MCPTAGLGDGRDEEGCSAVVVGGGDGGVWKWCICACVCVCW